LRIAGLRRATVHSVVLTFDAPAAFRTFTPGQYLTLRTTIDGQDVRRCYSICSGLDDAALQVGLKHLPGGLFSTWANIISREGDTLLVMRPEGRFGVAIDPGGSRVFAGFAAGSGITPILTTDCRPTTTARSRVIRCRRRSLCRKRDLYRRRRMISGRQSPWAVWRQQTVTSSGQ
jgi:ferredoxin-NADP reductase